MRNGAGPDDPSRADAISKATAEVNTTKAAVTMPNVTPNREKPWGFWAVSWGGSMHIATAIRPGEIYRVLQEMREMTPEEAQLHQYSAGVGRKSARIGCSPAPAWTCRRSNRG